MKTMPKPKSRPKCPSCYGEGKENHPVFGGMVPCMYCDGTGFDPYYTKPTEEKDSEDSN